MNELRDFAKSTGGLLDDDIRRIVWPVLARNMPSTSHVAGCSEEEELDEVNVVP